jgi:hypothetical protein
MYALTVPLFVIDGMNYPPPLYWAFAVVAVIAFPVAGVYACLSLRAGIGAGPGHIVVRGGDGHTLMIPWTEVTGYALHVGTSKGDGDRLEVLTADGKRHRTSGCTLSGLTARAKASSGWHLIRSLEDARPAGIPAAAIPARPPEPGRADRRAARILAVIGVVACLIVCGLMVRAGHSALGPELRAVRGQGTLGYYIPQSECASRQGCDWVGEFRLPDGTVTRRNVDLLDAGAIDRDDPGATVQAGVPVPALDVGAPSGVYLRDDPAAANSAMSWIATGYALAAALVLLVVAVLLPREPRRRRSRR